MQPAVSELALAHVQRLLVEAPHFPHPQHRASAPCNHLLRRWDAGYNNSPHMPKRKAEDPVAISSTMSLIFYRAPMSTAVITDAVLAELDTPHETVIVDIKVSPPQSSTALH